MRCARKLLIVLGVSVWLSRRSGLGRRVRHYRPHRMSRRRRYRENVSWFWYFNSLESIDLVGPQEGLPNGSAHLLLPIVLRFPAFCFRHSSFSTPPLRERTGSTLGPPVFLDGRDLPPKPSRMSKRFKFYVRKAKLPERERLSFHNLRHTTGSWLAMQGVPMRVIQQILGHSTIQVTERYSHLSPEVLVKAMEETFGGL